MGGLGRALFLPTEGGKLRAFIEAAQERDDHGRCGRRAERRQARALHVAPAADRPHCHALLRAARKAAKAGQLQGAQVQSTEWFARRADLDELFESGEKLAKLRGRYHDALVPEAWEQDLLEARHDLNAAGRHWWRSFSGSYRRARHKVATLCRAEPPRDTDHQIELIDAVRDARRHRAAVRQHEPLGARLLGLRWQGERSSWQSLNKLSKWARHLQTQVRQKRLPEGLVEFLASDPDVSGLPALARALREALAQHREALRALAAFLESRRQARAWKNGRSAIRRPWSELWARRADDLQGLVAFNHLAARCREDELGGLIPLAESWPDAGRHLARAFLQHWYGGLLDHGFGARKALAGFDAQSQEHVVRRFRDLDCRSLDHNRAWLARELWQRLPKPNELGVLRREMEKKTRHKPLRTLLNEAIKPIRAVKPVFMMSPLSVASYLDPELPQFDLVIFDEASQVKPVDALGALLRRPA